MFSPTHMMVRGALIAVLLIVVSTGCSNQKPAPFEPESRVLSDGHEAPFNPQERYPGWAFDQPEYMQPNVPLDSEMPIRGDDPNHFFTNNCVVLIEQPNGYTPEEIPRIAVYRSDDNGFTWKRDGMFGREQQYYALETHADGDYGIRFVGPGQQLAERTPADPQRVYHVDTQPPVVEVEINPEKTWYRPGDQIKIAWAARDPHLIANPVRLGMLMDFTGDIRNLVELQRDLADEGSMTYRIMPDTAGHEIVFRVEALDRAENLGLAYSHHLQVVDQDAEQIVQKRARRPHDDRMPARQPAPRTAPVQSNPPRAMETMTPISQATPAPQSKSTTIEAAQQPNTPTVISAASMTNDELAVNDRDDASDSIMRPEREPAHKSIAIRTAAKKDDRVPTMTAVTVAPRATTSQSKTDTVVAKKEKSKKDEAQIAADAARAEEVIASFKSAFSKMATTVATAAEEAQKEQAMARGDDKANDDPDEAKTTSVTVASRDEETTNVEDAPSNRGRTSVKVVPVAARNDSNAAAPRSTSRGTAPIATPESNTLVAPMPGIVAKDNNAGGDSHPWRSLGKKSDGGKAPVWSLPSDKPSLRGQPTIRVVEQPTRSKKVYAGTPTEDETPIERP